MTTVTEDVGRDLDYVEVQDLTNEYLLCRALGHAWDENPSAEVPMTPIAMAATAVLCLRCIRCTTERWDFLNAAMEVFSRRYLYPSTYRRLRAEQRRRPVLRAEMFGRSLLIRRLTEEPTARRRRRS
jgi:hypothetical protein